MIKQNKLVPKRRFEEFEKEWRKSKFLEIVFRLSEKSKEDIPRVEFEDINSGLGTLNKDIYKKKSEKIGVKFNSGDILFGKLRPYLKNWLLADFDGIAVGDFWVLRPNDNNSELIYALIQGEKYQQIANLSTGTKMPRSDWEIVSNTKFALPASNKEQQKIGNFFKHLDEMIALQQRKIDKTKALKSAYLAEMFPAEGEHVPKRRFEGFVDEWEERKFEQEIELYSGLTYSPKDVRKKGTFVLRSSNVQHGEVVNADNVYVNSEVVNSSNVRKGDIIVVVRNGSRSLIGKHAQIKEEMNETVIGAFMTGIRSNETNFINALLDTPNFKGEIDKNLGATINQITNSMFKNMSFFFPSVEEQQKIGQFFKHLDEMIATHQQKLEKLKATKQAYLHEMFV